MTLDRIVSLLVTLTPVLALVVSIVVAWIARPAREDKGAPEPVLGLPVTPTEDPLVAELRDRVRDAERREQRAWEERDAYRVALNAANMQAAQHHLAVHHPDLKRKDDQWPTL